MNFQAPTWFNQIGQYETAISKIEFGYGDRSAAMLPTPGRVFPAEEEKNIHDGNRYTLFPVFLSTSPFDVATHLHIYVYSLSKENFFLLETN